MSQNKLRVDRPNQIGYRAQLSNAFMGTLIPDIKFTHDASASIITMKYYRRMAYAAAWLPTCIFSGCGAGGNLETQQLASATIIKHGQPLPDHSSLPKPLLLIVEPEALSHFPAGMEGGKNGGIRCVIRVEVPPGGKVPEAIIVQIMSGRMLAGSNVATIKQKLSHNAWLLEGRLESPSRRGSYLIRAEGIQTLIVEGKVGEPESVRNITRVYSNNIPISID